MRSIFCSRCPNRRQKGQSYCAECHAAYMREHRPKYSELTDEQRLRTNARAYLHMYVKRGKIVKSPCVVCGDEKVEACHEDYNKPLEVIWRCKKHRLQHQRIKKH